ncbi:hypothetical protein N9V31_04420 [Candidatus Poseidonia alphae]|nr:hypothetical protein [Candidatus Poseidonia alphae]
MVTEEKLKLLGRLPSMVEILCPHCEEEIALDDDASGEFSCPHCDGDFEWNVDEEDSSGYLNGFTFDASSIKPIAVVQGAIVGISFIVLLMCFTADPLYTLSIEDDEWLYSADTMTADDIYGMGGTEKYTSFIDHLTEQNEECVTYTGEKCAGIEEMIEAMAGWDSAGNTYQFLMLIALISVILMPILSLTFMLYERNVIDMPVKAAVVVHFSGRGAYYFGCFMWFLAIILHMILAPEATGPIGMGQFDVGMFGYAGAFWFGLVMSLLAPIVHAALWFVPQDN